MANKKPLCCIIDYVTKDGVDEIDWKVVILAYSLKDALSYLRLRVPKIRRINSQEAFREIDVFHPDIVRDFLTENVVEEREVEVEVPVEVIREVEVIKEVQVADNTDPTCPWCEKVFKTQKTLQTHCLRFHLKED